MKQYRVQQKKPNKQKAQNRSEKKSPVSKQGISQLPGAPARKREPEQEQNPEQYALDTLSEKGQAGAKAVKNTVRELTKEKDEPVTLPSAPRSHGVQASRTRHTDQKPKSRDTPETVYHSSSQNMKTADTVLKDKNAVTERQDDTLPPDPAKQAYIRQKQADFTRQHPKKYKTESMTAQSPASDFPEAGLSISEYPPAEQAKQSTLQQAYSDRRPRQANILPDHPSNLRNNDADTNTVTGKSVSNDRPDIADSTHTTGMENAIQTSVQANRNGWADIPDKDSKPPSNAEAPDTGRKKLKTGDRQTGTIKTKEKPTLKHHKEGFKADTAKNIKTTGDTENGALQAKRTAQVSQTAGQAGAAASKAGTGAATGGVTAALEVVKKGAEKLQELAEQNYSKTNEPGNTPKLGCFGTVACVLFVPCFLVFFLIFGGSSYSSGSNKNLSAEVLAYMPLIQQYCQKYEIPEYVSIVAAIMMQESGGRASAVNGDVMQAAESQGWPAGTPIEPELSIDYGVRHFKSCLTLAGMPPPGDLAGISLSLQGYNFGTGYITWALNTYGGYTKENAIEFSHIWAVKMGWSSYGDVSYVEHVLRYYEPGGTYGGVGDIGLIGDGLIAYPMPGYTWETYSGHSGIDINGGGVNGKPVMAAASGKVTYVQNNWTASNGTAGLNSYGNVIYIDHEGTPYQTRYAHLSYGIVAVGDYVQQGQIIGYVGSTGNSSGPHLHFEIVVSGSSWHPDGRCYAEHAFPQYMGD